MSIGQIAINGRPLLPPLPNFPPSTDGDGILSPNREPPLLLLVLIIALLFVGVVGSHTLCNPARAQQPKSTAITPVPDSRFTVPAIACPPKGFCLDGTVTRVIDGDTVVVRSEIEYHVRLLDCWAPESRTKDLAEKSRGLQAKARMSELATNQPCRVFMPATDNLTDMITMGRILGRVWILQDGSPVRSDLSAVMVSEGLATTQKMESKP
jgi:endonuclease YncB( thermonuclease family)